MRRLRNVILARGSQMPSPSPANFQTTGSTEYFGLKADLMLSVAHLLGGENPRYHSANPHNLFETANVISTFEKQQCGPKSH